jgi:catechol-2,3-dioxygenase
VRIVETLGRGFLVVPTPALESIGVPVEGTFDVRVSKALFVSDPDGNLVELYIDALPEEWRDDPSLLASVAPLVL